QRETDHAVSPADDRAGYRFGHRGPGPRRPLLGRRRGCRPHCRALSPARPLRHAASARARHGRGRPADAAAAGQTEDSRRGGEGGSREIQIRLATSRRRNKGEKANAVARRAVVVEITVMSAQEGKSRRRKLSEEERALWQHYARSIAPLARREAAGSQTTKA